QEWVKELTFDAGGRVLVSVRATLAHYVDGLKEDLVQLGMDRAEVFRAQNMIQGYLPIERILDMPNLANFSTAVAVPKPILRTGSVTSQGDHVILADAFRAGLNVNGSGVQVGVISDSVNQVDSNNDGVVGIAESQATGDLPPAGVQVLRDDASNGTDEGRAMLEIINDIAPGASL